MFNPLRLLPLCQGLMLTIGLLALPAMAWAKAPTPFHAFALPSYMGTWYEVARLPNAFQNDCAQNTVVRYQLTKAGTIAVDNRCVKPGGQVKQSSATARVQTAGMPGVWSFSFFEVFGKPLGAVPYWVLGFNPGKYAIVGQPGRQFGWVLARQPMLSGADWSAVKQQLTQQGYNPCAFKRYPQSTAGQKGGPTGLCL
jgi:apolipoprotein D and lipocalin family protein